MRRSRRILNTAILMLIPSARKRTNYLQTHQLFGNIGNDVHIQSRKLPLYSELIFIHNNVKIASNVTFLTHDIIHKVLNTKYPDEHFMERVGCIEIMDNVFVGAGTQIMCNVRIGSNVIIGAGSIVTKDIPGNGVYAGAPARYICSFEEYTEKAREYTETFSKRYKIDKSLHMDMGLARQIYFDFKKGKDKRY